MRYNYFASVAKKEGYEQISAIFTETSDNEKEHAKRFCLDKGYQYTQSHNSDKVICTHLDDDGKFLDGNTFYNWRER